MKTITIFTAGILTGGAIIAAIAFKSSPVSFEGLPFTSTTNRSDTGDLRNIVAAGDTGRGAKNQARAWDYRWHPPQLPTEIDFAGEAVPLDRWEVRERLDRELLVNSYQIGRAHV